MADIISGNAVIGQSGGPTAVINQSMVGVVETLREAGVIDKILGARHAVRGIIENSFLELQDVPQDKLDRIANTPSSALGSTRDKPDAEYCEKIFKVLKQQNVHYFFYIGGNDSSDTCRIVNELSNDAGYELRCFHVPKTIDNDLMENDHTPGFASAAKFVAQAFMGDNLDNKAIPGVKIDVVMGRHAGFLTAAAGFGRQSDADGPHLIYVPEVAFDEASFLGDVDGVLKQHGRCVIAVSEGIHDKDGTPMAKKLAAEVEHDAHGNIQLSGSGALGDFLSAMVKEKLGVKRVRADTLGYLQRSFVGCTSEVDAREAREVGRKAAQLAMSGDIDGSVAIKRTSDDPYTADFVRVELTDIAAKTRVLEPRFLDGTNNITPAFFKYLGPLLGEVPHIEQF